MVNLFAKIRLSLHLPFFARVAKKPQKSHHFLFHSVKKYDFERYSFAQHASVAQWLERCSSDRSCWGTLGASRIWPALRGGRVRGRLGVALALRAPWSGGIVNGCRDAGSNPVSCTSFGDCFLFFECERKKRNDMIGKVHAYSHWHWMSPIWE